MIFVENWKSLRASWVGDALIIQRCVVLSEVSSTKGEIQALSDTFTEANKNITCFAVASILRMLEESSCEHVPGL
jgi:hypothetical protein